MRRLLTVSIVSSIVLAGATQGRAQIVTPDSQSPTQAAAQTAPGTGTELTGSLFDINPNQFEFGGRLSSVSGDPARYQRYQDLRDGVLFTGAGTRAKTRTASGCSGRRPTTWAGAISVTSPITSGRAGSW